MQNSAQIDSLTVEIKNKETEIKILKDRGKKLTTELQEAQDKLRESANNIEKLQNKLINEKDEYIKLLDRLKSVMTESIAKDSSISDVSRKVVAWSDDKKYIVVMYFHNNVGNISVIDISSEKVVKNIPINKAYNQIIFSNDKKKLIADTADILEIEKES